MRWRPLQLRQRRPPAEPVDGGAGAEPVGGGEAVTEAVQPVELPVERAHGRGGEPGGRGGGGGRPQLEQPRVQVGRLQRDLGAEAARRGRGGKT